MEWPEIFSRLWRSPQKEETLAVSRHPPIPTWEKASSLCGARLFHYPFFAFDTTEAHYVSEVVINCCLHLLCICLCILERPRHSFWLPQLWNIKLWLIICIGLERICHFSLIQEQDRLCSWHHQGHRVLGLLIQDLTAQLPLANLSACVQKNCRMGLLSWSTCNPFQNQKLNVCWETGNINLKMCNGNVFMLHQLWQTVVALQPLLQTASIHLPIVRKWLKLMTTKL